MESGSKAENEAADSVSVCLSKGLGAPVGSVIVGTKTFIDRVLVLKLHLEIIIIVVIDPVHERAYYLDMEHKRKLREEFGIEPWTFRQKLGDAVFVPAGCPYQVRNLKSCTKVEVNFVSPESVSECIRLQHELRMFPDNHRAKQDKLNSGTYVVVTVEPEGVVAIPNAKEREMVVYNIVCDELVVGIPHKAWWVVILAVVWLVVAFVIPSFLPSVLIASGADRTRGSPSKNPRIIDLR